MPGVPLLREKMLKSSLKHAELNKVLSFFLNESKTEKDLKEAYVYLNNQFLNVSQPLKYLELVLFVMAYSGILIMNIFMHNITYHICKLQL